MGYLPVSISRSRFEGLTIIPNYLNYLPFPFIRSIYLQTTPCTGKKTSNSNSLPPLWKKRGRRGERKKRAVGGKKTTPLVILPIAASKLFPIAEHRYPDRFLNGPLLYEDPRVPCSKVCQACSSLPRTLTPPPLSLKEKPFQKKKNKRKGRKNLHIALSNIDVSRVRVTRSTLVTR